MEIAFYLAGLIAVAATIRVITHTNPVHALLYLIVSLLAISAVFFSLGAYFAAALEIIVYAGAIMVLFVFVVMMLNLGNVQQQERDWILLREFLDWMPKRLDSYVKAALKNSILKGRSIGVASYNAKEALEWGVTGAGLRATGVEFDVRKWRPYSGYENFDFEVPVGDGNSDCYTRVMLKVEELRQSLRILEQCLNNMPEGPFKADHPLTTPPPKERTLQHIETLITHFLQVSWGPVMPANESFQMIEATKGINSYYLTSDGSTMSYRTRVRTPSFAHLQQIPSVIRGSLVSDLIVYLGSIDFVMSDVDR